MSSQIREIITNSNEDLKDMLQDENTALCHLAFWGHPAWMGSVDNTLSTTAMKQLVMYHRMRVALHKWTVAQIIGGVRGVIPDSKLAKYGDYRYDIDFEDMYCSTEDIEKERLFVKKQVGNDFSQQSLYFSKPLETGQDLSPLDRDKKESDLNVKKAISEWLNKIKNVLEGARRIARDAQPLDYWTEELIKICLRFIYVSRINDSLLKIMNTEIAFVTDYEQLNKEPVSRIELLSLPQPSFVGDSTQESKAMDALWMKLASPQVRRLWPNEDKTSPFKVEESFDDQQSSMIKVNFLRRCLKKKDLDFPAERIDISKDVAVKLLGSLLQVIDETPKEPNAISSVQGTEHRSYFPQAHGDWTKQLFPRRMNSDLPPAALLTAPVKNTIVQNSVRKIPTSDLPSMGDHVIPPEGLMMPLRFYKCVPPPPLACAARIQAIRQQQYVHRQIRSSMVKMPTCHPMPQQVQGKVPGVPVVSFPPPGYIQTLAPLNSWNNTRPQRANASIQVTAQYPKINTGIIYQQSHSRDVTEILKHQPKREEIDFSSGSIIPRQNEDVLGTRRERTVYENAEIKIPIDPIAWARNKPLPQANCETKVPLRVLQNITRKCKILKPAVYEKCLQQASANVYGIKPPVQMPEPGMTMVNSNGLKVIRLPPLGIQHTFPLRNPTNAHFTYKPRFMGGITVNDLRLVQEKMLYQRDKYAGIEEIQKGVSIDNFSLNRKENCTTSEDKVEKWLETVNFYMKSGSCISLKELSVSTQLEISSDSYKLDSNCKTDDRTESVEWPDNGYNMVKIPVKVSNSTDGIIYGDNSKAFSKCKTKNVRKLLLKHLHASESSLKLKKGGDLEGKVKLLKRYFAEMNLKGIELKFRLKRNIRNLKFEKPHPKKKRVDIPKSRAKSAHRDKCSFVFGTKHDAQPLRSENYFENINFSTGNINEFKVLSRESNEFNAFPSKRRKMCSSVSLFLDKELWTYNELKGKISSINYFGMVTDDLFFSQKNPTEELSENHPANSGRINGWTHFKIVIKSILENILATLYNRNTNTSLN